MVYLVYGLVLTLHAVKASRRYSHHRTVGEERGFAPRRKGATTLWIIFALSAALFGGGVAVLTKIGIKNINSNLATAIRTVVVAVFAWLMVLVVGSRHGITDIDGLTLLFLVLSGLATGFSWLCYFRSLQLGDVNKVVPVKKASTILTMVLSFLLFDEGLTWLKVAAMVLIGAGTYLMLERRAVKPRLSDSQKMGTPPQGALPRSRNKAKPRATWLFYAILAAVFASLTAILGKVGIVGVESNLGTAIRTMVVLAMAWLIVFFQGKHREIKKIDGRSWFFLVLSGIATGLSWLCFYRALQEGPVSAVVPLDKLSILVTVAFGYFVLRERLNKAAVAGLALIVAGTLMLLV